MSDREEIEYEETVFDADEIDDDDYGFIFDAEGNIKFVFVPDVLPFKPPKTIMKIMKILGVTDLSQFNDTTGSNTPLH